MTVVAIIQARIGSTRLPAKVLMDVSGRSMIDRIVDRVSAASLVEKIVVATTTDKADDLLAAHIRNRPDCGLFRGSADDVLSRFYECAMNCGASVIVRITADDPLKDPGIIDRAITLLSENSEIDYCSNTLTPTYPEGLDVEVVRLAALRRAYVEAKLPSEREHVTPYIWNRSSEFRLANFSFERDLSHWRWTVDYAEDLEFMRWIFSRFPSQPLVDFREVIRLIEENPNHPGINRSTQRNEGYFKSTAAENRSEK